MVGKSFSHFEVVHSALYAVIYSSLLLQYPVLNMFNNKFSLGGKKLTTIQYR